MPIHQTYLRPGLLYEQWDGPIEPNELYANNQRFVEQVQQENLPLNIVIVEVLPGAKIPLMSVLVNVSKKFPKGKVQYLVISKSTFHKQVSIMLTRLVAIPLIICPDLPTAVDLANKRLDANPPSESIS
ncbi:MAG TPA: hypothetical protein PLQ56_04730 [Aggregatilineales bacterium]|nr:hypothetical protein [Aggregatilineales bacterium]